MERCARRIITIGIILSLALSMVSFALGEQAPWDCPECGREGNTGNYCGWCAHPAPWKIVTVQPAQEKIEMTPSLTSTPVPMQVPIPTATPFFEYSYKILADGTIEITRYSGMTTQIVIPGSIDGYVVTSIGREAFYKSNIESIIIPEGVTTIGKMAFYSSNQLRYVLLPASVCSIGQGAFDLCERVYLDVYRDSYAHAFLFNMNEQAKTEWSHQKTYSYGIIDHVFTVPILNCSNKELRKLIDALCIEADSWSSIKDFPYKTLQSIPIAPQIKSFYKSEDLVEPVGWKNFHTDDDNNKYWQFDITEGTFLPKEISRGYYLYAFRGYGKRTFTIRNQGIYFSIHYHGNSDKDYDGNYVYVTLTIGSKTIELKYNKFTEELSEFTINR